MAATGYQLSDQLLLRVDLQTQQAAGLKILVDVDVYIDVLTKRAGWEESVRVLHLVRNSPEVEGWASALTVRRCCISSGCGALGKGKPVQMRKPPCRSFGSSRSARRSGT